MKKLLLDVDEVIVDSGFIKAINDFLGTNYKLEDCKEYYIDKLLIPEDRWDEFGKFLRKRNLYEEPIFMKDSIDVIKKLNEVYDIYVCSSCINPIAIETSGRMFKDKYDFLIKYLPFLDPNKFIFTSVKGMFNADIQIDDRLCNFCNPSVEVRILFPSYHNLDISDEELSNNHVVRAGTDVNTGWKEIEKILLSK